MAVHAPNIALGYLREDDLPRFVRGEDSDLTALCRRIPMIELEDENVCLAAINAGMHRQVLEEANSVLDAVTRDARDLALDIHVAVVEIVLTPICRVALSAM